jgi:hypothetical protein
MRSKRRSKEMMVRFSDWVQTLNFLIHEDKKGQIAYILDDVLDCLTVPENERMSEVTYISYH